MTKPSLSSRVLSHLFALDRRVIYALLTLVLIAALLLPFPLPIQPALQSRRFFDQMESLKRDEVILLAGVYGPDTAPEIHPMVKATLGHAFRKGVKVVMMGLWPQSPGMMDQAVSEVLHDEEFRNNPPRYGEDYVNLGYMSGFILVVQSMNRSIHETFPTDTRGTPVENLPLMRRVKSFEEVSMVVELAAGGPAGQPVGGAFVMFAKPDNPAFRIIAGSTAVMAAESRPYLQTGQLQGFLAGLKGAADYEHLLGFGVDRGDALRVMPAQSVAHVLIFLFIVLGNLGLWWNRRHGGRQPGKDGEA